MLRRRTAVLLLVCLALAYGCQRSPEDARKELAELGIEYTPYAFHQAVGNNDKLAVELFIAAGVNINLANKLGNTALIMATIWGHTEIVQALLDAGAEPDLAPVGITALKLASREGHTEIVRILREAMADGK